MKTQLHEPVPAVGEPHLLLQWDVAEERTRHVEAGIGSLVIHIILGCCVFYVASLPPSPVRPIEESLRSHNVTPLIAPPMEITQKAPNKAPVSKEINLESLRPSDNKPAPANPGASEQRAQVRKFRAPTPIGNTAAPTPQVVDAPAIDPNKLKTSSGPVPSPLGLPNMPSPQIATEEKPKLAFEKPGTETGASGQTGLGRIPVPKTSVQEAIRSAVRHGGQGMVVGDDEESEKVLPSVRSSPMPGKLGSSVQLLSDPMGIDFWPYLIKVLTAVRKNWYAVIPESARLGRGGVCSIQFAINRDGGVPKLVIAMPSGTEALDRAAVAGISASNPFPPLPSDFRGPQVRLQLTFKYSVNH